MHDGQIMQIAKHILIFSMWNSDSNDILMVALRKVVKAMCMTMPCHHLEFHHRHNMKISASARLHFLW